MEPTSLNKLKRVGLSLIVVGLIDVAVMVYSIANRLPYASCFNVFAIIAGSNLYFRKSVKSARVIAFFSAFLFSGFAGIALISSLYIPSDFLWVLLKIHTALFVSTAIGYSLVIVYLVWLYRELSTTSMKELKQESAFISWGTPSSGFKIGALLSILFAIVLITISQSSLTSRAIERASKEFGSDFNCFISSYSSQNEVTTIKVICFNFESYSFIDFVFDGEGNIVAEQIDSN